MPCQRRPTNNFNGVTFFNQPTVHGVFELDTCLDGLGGRYNDFVYHIALLRGYQNMNICHLEMLNVLVTLCEIWGHIFKNKRLIVNCDNLAAVNVLKNGKTSDNILATIARNIQMEAMRPQTKLAYNRYFIILGHFVCTCHLM